MRSSLVAAGILIGFLGSVPGVAVAHGPPPPPPTLTPCLACSGPPPPPASNLVPTAPPNTLPRATVVVSVSVHLTPSRVRRGRPVKLLIASAAHAAVRILVRYRAEKPSDITGRTDAAGKLRLTLKVPRDVPLGEATVTVTVRHSPKPYVATVSFTVIR